MQDSNLILSAVSPLDGRYHSKTLPLRDFVSESALIGYRIKVEAAWMLRLASHPEIGKVLKLSAEIKNCLEGLVNRVPESAAPQVKDIESTTNHDVKAVEYYLRDELKRSGADDQVLAFIHFACTSEDINNLSYGLMSKEVRDRCLLPQMEKIISNLEQKSQELADIPMLSRTHGQTASPSTMGKELAVFAYRLARQKNQLDQVDFLGKMSGAVGNYNAHLSAFPNVDWIELARGFVEKDLGLTWNPLTTQIENHDSLIEYTDILKRFNTIAIDLARDVWGYISLGYFSQSVKAGEVGSSTMPHKVNPIDFENAEGNYGLSSALATHFAEKLPISRWQRDLSDSTVLRSFGTLVGHSYLAGTSLLKGLSKIAAAPHNISRDLDQAWEVLAEPVQTVMRRYGVVDAYERLKAATRGQAVTKEAIHASINSCDEIPNDEKARLLDLTPNHYVGIASKLAKEYTRYHSDK